MREIPDFKKGDILKMSGCLFVTDYYEFFGYYNKTHIIYKHIFSKGYKEFTENLLARVGRVDRETSHHAAWHFVLVARSESAKKTLKKKLGDLA